MKIYTVVAGLAFAKSFTSQEKAEEVKKQMAKFIMPRIDIIENNLCNEKGNPLGLRQLEEQPIGNSDCKETWELEEEK